MGTPDFAVPCLKQIIADGHNVAAVYTRADKPVGRKKILTPPPVKVEALNNNIAVFQPEKIKGNSEVYEHLKSLNPDVLVVVAYGRILPKEILDIPKIGAVNVHGSLLPRYRGASPIQWSIVCGDTKTGVTTMLMDEGIDTGDMLIKSEVDISDTDTYETLHHKLAEVGAETLSKTLFLLENGEIKRIKQPDEGVSYAPIITKQMGQLDFTKPAKELDCKVRGFTPWPLAYFYFNDRRYKIYGAKTGEKTNKPCGTYYTCNNRAFVACGDNVSLEITEICPDGSKQMNSSAFINGRFIESNSLIEFKKD